ncbi:prefoldin subunit 6-like [Hibiscus syriacus]|uniref:prefoldin subunit 6-like n=1 Tax=Hibiscus syriacus TaxID=106335 RepID=UPI001925107B|nr:prefoldin subunit 6-like [Hibiscus syriacus]
MDGRQSRQCLFIQSFHLSNPKSGPNNYKEGKTGLSVILHGFCGSKPRVGNQVEPGITKQQSNNEFLLHSSSRTTARPRNQSKLQKDIAKNHQVRKKYTIQLGENELVLKELDLLNEDANVYKLIGPVLVKQDLAEANANVRKRIEYISAELKRLDGSLQDLEEKQHSKREAISKVQQRIQSHQAGKAKA